ncbi:Aste57867_15776 [Aphanomyces stellatus]|uniref:Aste57867_15776 protein n=1 Tax=Aphanomyces stellatus TaxID=120398 RepID=A0A485L576_9STRA|nr:hypothetical protein As57867_015720 [Aphanomyces stellatus]VFT92564.1 Aste57867_15776 [Aphanomyces stellatus]
MRRQQPFGGTLDELNESIHSLEVQAGGYNGYPPPAPPSDMTSDVPLINSNGDVVEDIDYSGPHEVETGLREPPLMIRWEGYLMKRSDWLKHWETYYFVLHGRVLYCYLSEEEAKLHPENSRIKHGKFSFSDNVILDEVISIRSRLNFEFIFETDKGKTIYLRAKSEATKQMWMHMACHGIVDTDMDQDKLQHMRRSAAPQRHATLVDFFLGYEYFFATLSNMEDITTLMPQGDPSSKRLGGSSSARSVVLPNAPITNFAPKTDHILCRFFSMCQSDIAMRNNYMPMVPFHGTFRGYAGLLEYFTKLAKTVAFKSFTVDGMTFEGQGSKRLVVVKGHEVMEVRGTGRSLSQQWIHKFLVKDDGRIYRWEINGDVVASSVAFKHLHNRGARGEKFRESFTTVKLDNIPNLARKPTPHDDMPRSPSLFPDENDAPNKHHKWHSPPHPSQWDRHANASSTMSWDAAARVGDPSSHADGSSAAHAPSSWEPPTRISAASSSVASSPWEIKHMNPIHQTTSDPPRRQPPPPHVRSVGSASWDPRPQQPPSPQGRAMGASWDGTAPQHAKAQPPQARYTQQRTGPPSPTLWDQQPIKQATSFHQPPRHAHESYRRTSSNTFGSPAVRESFQSRASSDESDDDDGRRAHHTQPAPQKQYSHQPTAQDRATASSSSASFSTSQPSIHSANLPHHNASQHRHPSLHGQYHSGGGGGASFTDHMGSFDARRGPAAPSPSPFDMGSPAGFQHQVPLPQHHHPYHHTQQPWGDQNLPRGGANNRGSGGYTPQSATYPSSTISYAGPDEPMVYSSTSFNYPLGFKKGNLWPDAPTSSTEEERITKAKQLDLCRPRADLGLYLNIATKALGCPIGTVCVVGGNAGLFVAKVGMQVDTVPREIILESHVIMGTEPTIVLDTSLDVRFATNPLVCQGDIGIRFYLGVPLVTSDGIVMGALSLIDTAPRTSVREKDVAAVVQIAQTIMNRVEDLAATAHEAKKPSATDADQQPSLTSFERRKQMDLEVD